MGPETLAAYLTEFFSRDSHGAAAVYLYGSVARGTQQPDSDLDVAILFATLPPLTVEAIPVDLQDQIAQLTGREVDLVTLNHASPDLGHRVLRDGLLVFEADRSARARPGGVLRSAADSSRVLTTAPPARGEAMTDAALVEKKGRLPRRRQIDLSS